jgi:hypothetical protein
VLHINKNENNVSLLRCQVLVKRIVHNFHCLCSTSPLHTHPIQSDFFCCWPLQQLSPRSLNLGHFEVLALLTNLNSPQLTIPSFKHTFSFPPRCFVFSSCRYSLCLCNSITFHPIIHYSSIS